MPKCVRIDVRQTVPLGKLIHPACYAVGVHWPSVILAKNEAEIITTYLDPVFGLPMLPLPE